LKKLLENLYLPNKIAMATDGLLRHKSYTLQTSTFPERNTVRQIRQQRGGIVFWGATPIVAGGITFLVEDDLKK